MAAFMFVFRGGNAGGDSPEQMQQHMQKWFSWFEGLSKSGVFKGQGAPLEPTGKVVGGYAIIEAKDLEAAVELARGCPTFDKDGAVEVRPVRPM